MLNPTAFGWVHLDLPFEEVHPAEPGEPWLYDYAEDDAPLGLRPRRASPRVEAVSLEWWPLPTRRPEGP